jgi:hypothetical protein
MVNAFSSTMTPLSFTTAAQDRNASDSDPRGASDLDPFAITLPSLVVFILETLGDIACVRALINVPRPRDGATYHKMIVVEIDRQKRWAEHTA